MLCLWFYLDMFGPNLMWPVVLMRPNHCEKFKRFKKISKFQRRIQKLQEGCHLRRKEKFSKETFQKKFKWKIGT